MPDDEGLLLLTETDPPVECAETAAGVFERREREASEAESVAALEDAEE